MPDLIIDGPDDAPSTLVLAHGAGAPMDSPFMARVARDVSRAGIRVVRFEFPYMDARRTAGTRRAPDRETALRASWLATIDRLGGGGRLVIGGKSLGGRIASMVADEAGVRGLVCLGYPFHAPATPEKPRTAHLATLRTPALVVQGARDPFGTPADVEGYTLSSAIRLVWIADGDHSFKPRARSGRTEGDNLTAAAEAVIDFVKSLERPA